MADATAEALFADFMAGTAPGLSSLAVAVSGGADSMALLLLAKDWAGPHNIPITALTVDHGLRAEAAVEARQVADWCEALAIPHETLRWAPAAISSAIQEQAREARYALMDGWCTQHNVPALLTAHHRDDQAETLFFRLARGSGLDGLACIQPKTWLDGGTLLLRPLLELPKSALIAVLHAANQPWVEDPSNQHMGYTRNRIRAALAATGKAEELSRRAGAVIASLTRFRCGLDAMFQQHWWDCVQQTPAGSLLDQEKFKLLQPDMALRILAQLARTVGGQPHRPRTHKLERFYTELMEGGPDLRRTFGGCIFAADDPRGHWRVTPEK